MISQDQSHLIANLSRSFGSSKIPREIIGGLIHDVSFPLVGFATQNSFHDGVQSFLTMTDISSLFLGLIISVAEGLHRINILTPKKHSLFGLIGVNHSLVSNINNAVNPKVRQNIGPTPHNLRRNFVARFISALLSHGARIFLSSNTS